jgi:hypothetical protein
VSEQQKGFGCWPFNSKHVEKKIGGGSQKKKSPNLPLDGEL